MSRAGEREKGWKESGVCFCALLKASVPCKKEEESEGRGARRERRKVVVIEPLAFRRGSDVIGKACGLARKGVVRSSHQEGRCVLIPYGQAVMEGERKCLYRLEGKSRAWGRQRKERARESLVDTWSLSSIDRKEVPVR